MSEMAILIPETSSLNPSSLVLQASGIQVVHDTETSLAAQRVLSALANRKKEIVAAFAPSKKAAHSAHAELCALEKKLLEPVESASKALGAAVIAFEDAERRRREAEALRALEEAKAKSLEEALELEKLGAPDAVVQQALDAVAVPVSVLPAEPVRAKGVSVRSTWSAEVHDKAALIAFVAANPLMHHLIEPAQMALDAMARAQKDALAVPGVRAVERKSTVAR